MTEETLKLKREASYFLKSSVRGRIGKNIAELLENIAQVEDLFKINIIKFNEDMSELEKAEMSLDFYQCVVGRIERFLGELKEGVK